MYLPESYTIEEAEATLYTEYAQTDDMCVELFYSNRGHDEAKLTIRFVINSMSSFLYNNLSQRILIQ